MATNDVQVFNSFAEAIGDGRIDLDTDTLKLGIVDDTLTPAADSTAHTWSDYSANEVVTTGGYTTDGETLASVTWGATGTANISYLDAANVTLTQDGSGFTDGRWGIIYSTANDECIAFVDTGTISEQAGDITFAWNALGILKHTVNDTFT